MLQTIENYVFDTGKVAGCAKRIGVHPTTLHNWIHSRSELGEAVTRAREAHRKFRDLAIQGELMAAVEGLNKLLNGHIVTLVDETTDEIRNEKTGEKLETVNVKVRKHQAYIRPDIRAIEKVLGPGDLRQAINLKAFEERMLNGKSDLYLLVFGQLVSKMDKDSIAEFVGVSVLNIQLDLLKLRYMEAHIQHLYDTGGLSVDQWLDYIQRIRRDYGMISDRMEMRAQKLLEGKSYQDIVYQMEELWRVLIETVREEMVKPVMLKKKKSSVPKEYSIPVDAVNQIMENIVTRVNERKSKSTYFTKRIS